MNGYRQIGASWYGHPIPDAAVWALLGCCAAVMLTAVLSSRYARSWARRLGISALCAAVLAGIALGWADNAKPAQLAATRAATAGAPATVNAMLAQWFVLLFAAGTVLLFLLGTLWARRRRGGRRLGPKTRGKYRAADPPFGSPGRYPLTAAPRGRGRR